MASATSPAVHERRGRHLPPIQTNFSRPTAHLDKIPRPHRVRPPNDTQTTNGKVGEKDQGPPSGLPTKRQSSRTGLRSFFGFEKSLRRPKSDSKLTQVDEIASRKPGRPAGQSTETPLLSPSTCATPKTTLSAPSLAASPPNGVGPNRTPKIPPKAPRRRPATNKPSEDRSYWRPPPLFQVYPQAIKHGCLPLPAPASLAESILRINGSGPKAPAKDTENNDGNQLLNPDSFDSNGAIHRKKREPRHQPSSSSGNMNKMEWTQKIYVLATSGYLLQYAGEGKFDRLPEKMMKLGPKSVAFASDAIPGKHWVLQVTQHFDEEATTSTVTVDGGRPLFSRFGFRPLGPRMARTLLLVFDNPEEMHSWLVAVRAEIEARGGKKYVSEWFTGEHEDNEEEKDTERQNNRNIRRPVKGGINQLSELRRRSQRGPILWENGAGVDYQSRRASYQSVNRRSVVSISGSTSAAPSEGELHGPGTPAASLKRFTSAGDSSNSLSPTEIPKAFQRQDIPNLASSQAFSTPSSPEWRPEPVHKYSQAAHATGNGSKLPRPPSFIQEPTARSSSPAPNFSVPSFSKKFATKPGQPAPGTQLPQPPSTYSSSTRKTMPVPVPSRTSSIPRADRMDYSSTVAAFPTPPQSPTPRVASPVRSDSNDKLSCTSRESSIGRQVSSSTSIDSIAEIVQRNANASDGPAEAKAQQTLSRLPRANVSAASISHRISMTNISLPATPASASARGAIQRKRISSIPYQNDPVLSTFTPSSFSTSVISHRKSLPGLSIGPPVAPPPNCPLPKIPSLIDPGPGTSLPNGRPPSARFSKSPPPSVQGIRKGSTGSIAFDGSMRVSGIRRPSIQSMNMVNGA